MIPANRDSSGEIKIKMRHKVKLSVQFCKDNSCRQNYLFLAAFCHPQLFTGQRGKTPRTNFIKGWYKTMKNVKVMETATIKEVEEYALHYPLLIAIKSGEEWFFYGAAISADHAAELIANRQKWGYAEMKVFNNPVLNGNKLILDCEWLRTGEVYDIGMTVVDKTGAIVFCRGWLINETISAGGTEAEEILKSHASYSGGQYRRGSFREVMHEVDNLMTEYGCQIPYAFNGWADIRAILRTAERYEVETPFWMSTIEKDGSVKTYGDFILSDGTLYSNSSYKEKYYYTSYNYNYYDYDFKKYDILEEEKKETKEKQIQLEMDMYDYIKNNLKEITSNSIYCDGYFFDRYDGFKYYLDETTGEIWELNDYYKTTSYIGNNYY